MSMNKMNCWMGIWILVCVGLGTASAVAARQVKNNSSLREIAERELELSKTASQTKNSPVEDSIRSSQSVAEVRVSELSEKLPGKQWALSFFVENYQPSGTPTLESGDRYDYSDLGGSVLVGFEPCRRSSRLLSTCGRIAGSSQQIKVSSGSNYIAEDSRLHTLLGEIGPSVEFFLTPQGNLRLGADLMIGYFALIQAGSEDFANHVEHDPMASASLFLHWQGGGSWFAKAGYRYRNEVFSTGNGALEPHHLSGALGWIVD